MSSRYLFFAAFAVLHAATPAGAALCITGTVTAQAGNNGNPGVHQTVTASGIGTVNGAEPFRGLGANGRQPCEFHLLCVGLLAGAWRRIFLWLWYLPGPSDLCRPSGIPRFIRVRPVRQ